MIANRINLRVPINRDGSSGYGHTDIVASINGNDIKGYDCGSSKFVKHGAYPDGVNIDWFLTDKRAGKIIRVTGSGL